MQSKEGESERMRMESLRLSCEAEISAQMQKIDAFASSFSGSLRSVEAKARETVQNQERLSKLKNSLKDAEDELVKALSVKTRNEAKRMALMDSIASIRSRLEELRRTVQDQKASRDKYATIISRESLALAASEEKNAQRMGQNGEVQEAISWYNKVLGFQIEGGTGVKFIFTNINRKNSEEVCSFTIRHANDTYTLLECDPPLAGTKEMIHELNSTNGLYKFVRIMRKKFQEAVEKGTLPQITTPHQEPSIISLSAPITSVSSERSESPSRTTDCQVQQGEVDGCFREVNHGTHTTMPTSPGSASSLRRSSRNKVKR